MDSEGEYLVGFWGLILNLLAEFGASDKEEITLEEKNIVEKVFNNAIVRLSQYDIPMRWASLNAELMAYIEEAQLAKIGSERKEVFKSIPFLDGYDKSLVHKLNDVIDMSGGKAENGKKEKKLSLVWILFSTKVEAYGKEAGSFGISRNATKGFYKLMEKMDFIDDNTYKMFVYKEYKSGVIQWIFNGIDNSEAFFATLDEVRTLNDDRKRNDILQSMLLEQCKWENMQKIISDDLLNITNIEKNDISIGNIIDIEGYLIRLLPLVKISKDGTYQIKKREEWQNEAYQIKNKVDAFMAVHLQKKQELYSEVRKKAFETVDRVLEHIFGIRLEDAGMGQATPNMERLCGDYLRELIDYNDSFLRSSMMKREN